VIQVRFFMKNASPTLVFGQKIYENVQHERALLISNWKTTVLPGLTKNKIIHIGALSQFRTEKLTSFRVAHPTGLIKMLF